MLKLINNSTGKTPNSEFRIPNLNRRSRSGISIIEVMTAVVVAMIGVFGTMVLIPFAVRQAQTGLDLDDARNLAVNSRATFEVMGFDDETRWAVGFAKTDASSTFPTAQTIDNVPGITLLSDP